MVLNFQPIPDSVRFASQQLSPNPANVNSTNSLLIPLLISIGVTITVVIYYERRLADKGRHN